MRAFVREARRACPSCGLKLQKGLKLLHAPSRRSIATASRVPSAGLAQLPSRQLLSISGLDAAKFLQGLVTANVYGSDGQPRTHGFYTALLNAKGRVLHDVFVYPVIGDTRVPGIDTHDGGGFLIEADASQMGVLAQYIKRYKLRAKVTVRPLDAGDAAVWQAWDDGASEAHGGPAVASGATTLAMRDGRAPGLGHRIVQLNGRAPELDMEHASEAAYTIRRYLRGVAEGQAEIVREQALPLESNMELMGAIDFRKGCYVGQELTIRTRHRGVVRKRILPCAVYSDHDGSAAPATLAYQPRRSHDKGTDDDDDKAVISSAESASESASESSAESSPEPSAESIAGGSSIGRVGKTGRSAGKWLAGTGNIGLALCRLEVMTDVVLPGEQPSAAYSVDDEFMLDVAGADKVVKVKAFAPEWLRRGLQAE